MAISKKDRKDIAGMIARAIKATSVVIDSQAVEDTAQESEWKVMRNISHIIIKTRFKVQYSGRRPPPSTAIITTVSIAGIVDGEDIAKEFKLQQSDQVFLNELMRIQSYPHLFQGAQVSFGELPPPLDRYIIAIHVPYDK